VTQQQITRWLLKPVVFVASLAPAVYLGLQTLKALGYLTWSAVADLSANPLSDVTNGTGDWTIRFVCIALAVTPVRRLTGWNAVIRFRRMLGLFAFFYATLHFLTYVGLDRLAGLDFPNGIVSFTTVRLLTVSIVADIYKRPFITLGFTGFALMVPLALTSTAGMIRRLGGRRWQALHRLIYLTGVAAVLHYWWLVKADIRKPAMYGAIVVALLGFRVYWARAHAKPAPVRPTPAQSPSASA
jgi:sulfoxide reductase heme-binding subunit YedZ